MNSWMGSYTNGFDNKCGENKIVCKTTANKVKTVIELVSRMYFLLFNFFLN